MLPWYVLQQRIGRQTRDRDIDRRTRKIGLCAILLLLIQTQTGVCSFREVEGGVIDYFLQVGFVSWIVTVGQQYIPGTRVDYICCPVSIYAYTYHM